MTKDEALKMAIEKLWACSMLMNLDHSDYLYEDVIQALDACKEALEQPAQTYEQGFEDGYDNAVKLGKYLNQTQEPVAWVCETTIDNIKYWKEKTPDDGIEIFCSLNKENDFNISLYTHPHQWQGLTDDEIDKVYCATYGTGSIDIDIDFARAIEAKLKEKNHG